MTRVTLILGCKRGGIPKVKVVSNKDQLNDFMHKLSFDKVIKEEWSGVDYIVVEEKEVE